MRLPIVLLSLVLATALLAHARPDPDTNPIRLRSEDNRLRRGYVKNCASFRLASEVNNARNWKTVPRECVPYVRSYMLNVNQFDKIKTQYEADCSQVVGEALDYLSTVTPTKDKNDTWLFDLTDTLLSTLAYYERSDVQFGGTPFNRTKFNEWLAGAEMPAVPYVSELFWEAKEKGFAVVILSGTSEDLRDITEANLKKAKLDGWDKLILKNKPSMPTKDFKASQRAQLKKDGFKVIGNVGDQWIDLLTGSNAGKRTFKIPNAMYYVK